MYSSYIGHNARNYYRLKNSLLTMILLIRPGRVHRWSFLRALATSKRHSSSGPKSLEEIRVGDGVYKTDEWTNVPNYILELTKRQLHLNPKHPIGILKDLIEKNFTGLGYTYYNNFKPVVTTFQNFDILGFPKDHVGRSKSDTYYLNKDHLLRTHTSAHENECFQQCKTPGYLITADVYRRDEIDKTHYPAFHQMEGARLWSKNTPNIEDVMQKDIDNIPKTNIIVEDPFRDTPINEGNPKQDYLTELQTKLAAIHLKKTVEYMVNLVFENAKKSAKLAGCQESWVDEPLRVRWVEAYFPWTSPSWEIEVWWNGDWLECCGCGIVQQHVLLNSQLGDDKFGWAFGIGLDRIAMLLFDIPDIRLFWSLDERFSKQFKQGQISTFSPYSKYPGIQRDIAFWIPENVEVHENDVMEIVRIHGSDLVENVALVDSFLHPKTNRRSQCYRINYQSMDQSLTKVQINAIVENVTKTLIDQFGVEIR